MLMATSDSTSAVFLVTGKPPPPRIRPRKLTNSEKTKTTSNLSQHKYLMIKRQLQLETERKLWSIQNSGLPISGATKQFLSVSQQNNDMADRVGEEVWYTSHKQKGYPLSGQTLRSRTTFRTTAAVAASREASQKQADLQKLLTSVQLTPRVPANPAQNRALSSHLQHPQNSSTSLSSDEDSLSQVIDIVAHETVGGGSKECPIQCLQMTFNESCDFDQPITARKSLDDPNSSMDKEKISWYSVNDDNVRNGVNGVHAKRHRTKSAPSGRRIAILCTQKGTECSRLEPDFSPLNSTYLSSDMQRPSSSRDNRRTLAQLGVNTNGVRAKKKGEIYDKKPSLFYSDPVPRSRWYEMKTPEFHIEAKRNNNFIRKVCNW